MTEDERKRAIKIALIAAGTAVVLVGVQWMSASSFDPQTLPLPVPPGTLYPPIGATWADARSMISSRFGPRDIGHGASKYHPGIDFRCPVGTPLRAVALGRIVMMKSAADGNAAGNRIVIDHDNGWQARYLHLSRFADFQVGARVAGGMVIGYSGNTGNTTGPPLHWEWRNVRAGFDAKGLPLAYNPEAAFPALRSA